MLMTGPHPVVAIHVIDFFVAEQHDRRPPLARLKIRRGQLKGLRRQHHLVDPAAFLLA